MTVFHEHFFVITGGPGSGKTTLLQSLEDRYFLVMPEGGRAIIQDQTAIGGRALPWEDKSAYAELMLNWELRSYREAPRRNRPVLFDRGIPDVIGYLELNSLPVPQHLSNAAEHYRYHRKVFIAPHWPEIYEKDAERKQSHDEAMATYHAMLEVYRRLGYELLELPKENLDRRVQFIMDNLEGMR
ncbi:AAA family ATPase [Oxalobacter sp. OttesenSCG-928-P03]|nr:AAA family ATPase [Oxalobacter sp. OttesenSCG-928-P03]